MVRTYNTARRCGRSLRLEALESRQLLSVSADSFEVDDSPSQANWIATDGTVQQHTIHEAGDTDWVRFRLDTSAAVTLETTGTSGDTKLYLYREGDTSNYIEYDDDDGEGYFSKIQTSLDSGTYFAKVIEYGENDTIDSYGLHVTAVSFAEDGYEPDDVPARATPISSQVPQTHSLHDSNDADWYRFDLTSQAEIDIFLDRSAATHWGRIYASLYSADNLSQRIDYDYTSSDSFDFSEVLDAGVYYVAVHNDAASPGSTAQYEITMVENGPITLDYPRHGSFVDSSNPVEFGFSTASFLSDPDSYTVDIVLDNDANTDNGFVSWIATNLPIDATEDGTISQTLSNLGTPGSTNYVWARLKDYRGLPVYYTPPTPLIATNVASVTIDALGDTIGGSGYEIFSAEAAQVGNRIQFRVLTNFLPNGDNGGDVYDSTGGDVHLNVGGDIWGLAVRDHSIPDGRNVRAGDLYSGAEFRGGTVDSSVPTFINAYSQQISGRSSIEAREVAGFEWQYEITGEIELDALTGFEYGETIEIGWAMYCGNDWAEAPIEPEQQSQWTVMVYMNGESSLEDDMLADFLEMAAVGSSDEVNIVVQMDRIPGNDTSYGNWTNTRRGRVESGDIPDTSWGTSIGEVNMGAASTLSGFAAWATSTYPAENYAIILWDHGDGFAGVCPDESSNDDELEVPELTAAFSTMSSDLRVIAFDACLMGMTELGYQFAPFADVFVGSEETLPNDGYNYAFLRSVVNNPEISATGLGSAIVNSLMSQPGYSSDDVTIAASHAAAIRSGVLSSINQLASAILGNSDFDWDQFWTDAANAQQFDEVEDVPFRDLADFMFDIAGGGYGSAVTGAANAVRNAVHAAVFAEDGTMPFAEGLSIYLPVEGDDVLSYFELYNDDHLDFVADGLWDELIAEGRMHQFAEGKGLYEAWSGFGYNHRGRQEKYFADKSGNWYAIVPNGAVYSAPFDFDDARIVTTLSEDYWADPNRMFLPGEQAPVITDPLEFAEGRGLYEAWNGFGVNHRGRNEKYFADSEGNWYAILPDGNIYSTPWVFDQSTIVASLDSMYWQDPNKLFGVGAPDTLAAYQFAHQRDLSEQWVGWGINHRGHNEKYFHSGAESQWYAILPNGEIHHSRAGWVFNSGSVVATTSADYWQDPNRLIYAANPNGLKAYQFANGLGLYQRWSNWRLNERGYSEKYFSDKNGTVYAILPNGQVHREASVFGSSSFYTALSNDYYRDPTLLFVYQ